MDTSGLSLPHASRRICGGGDPSVGKLGGMHGQAQLQPSCWHRGTWLASAAAQEQPPSVAGACLRPAKPRTREASFTRGLSTSQPSWRRS